MDATLFDTVVVAGMVAGLLALLAIWEGCWRCARVLLLAAIAAPLVCAASHALPAWPALAVSGCLTAMLLGLRNRENRISKHDRAAGEALAAAGRRLGALRDEEARLTARGADIDASIAASHSIYQVTRDLGGAITMVELRRELGRLFKSLLAPSEALLLYLDIEASQRRFYRIYDLLAGCRLRPVELAPQHPVTRYFADPTARGIMALEEGPEGPARALIFLTFREQVVGGIYLDGMHVKKEQALDPRVLLYTLAVLVNLANNKCLLYLDIERTSRYDALTMLYKRWHFMELAAEELARSLSENRAFALLMLDIDHFKDFNDTHGHLAGDNVLRMVGVFLKEHVRTQDIVCRYGGEEFVIVLVDTQRDGARVVAERLRLGLAERPVSIAGGLTNITVSIGGACFPADSSELPPLIHMADEAMYRAKGEGRNRVVFWAQAPRPEAQSSDLNSQPA